MLMYFLGSLVSVRETSKNDRHYSILSFDIAAIVVVR